MNLNRIMYTEAGWGMTFMRVVAGIIYIGHGLPKMGVGSDRTLQGTAEWLGSIGIPLPMLGAWAVVGAEVVGGAMLVLGLLTRLAATTQVIAMAVATFVVHWPNGMFAQGGYQWSLLLMACSLCLLIDGAGKLSVDQKIAGKN